MTETGFADAWSVAVNRAAAGNGLSAEDIALLVEFGEDLGRTDMSGQTAHIRAYAELIDRNRKDAEQTALARAPIFRTVGIAGGVALALLLL